MGPEGDEARAILREIRTHQAQSRQSQQSSPRSHSMSNNNSSLPPLNQPFAQSPANTFFASSLSQECTSPIRVISPIRKANPSLIVAFHLHCVDFKQVFSSPLGGHCSSVHCQQEHHRLRQRLQRQRHPRGRDGHSTDDDFAVELAGRGVRRQQWQQRLRLPHSPRQHALRRQQWGQRWTQSHVRQQKQRGQLAVNTVSPPPLVREPPEQ